MATCGIILFAAISRIRNDAGKIERELQWKSSESFESGLHKTVSWFLVHADWVELVRSGLYRNRGLMRMKILVFGKNGQVGHELKRTLLPLGDVTCFGHADADLEDLVGLRALLVGLAPELIVNAAAYTAVAQAETDELRAMRVNAEAVAIMAEYAAENETALLHYSTDYIFDGLCNTRYKENDVAVPQGVYDRSKRAGEIAILNSSCKFLIFRISWIFSAHGRNFVKTMLRLATERTSLNVVFDQFGAPTSAELVADVTVLAVSKWKDGSLNDGIYHLTAAGETSWYGLAAYVIARVQKFGYGMQLDRSGLNAIPANSYPQPAARLYNSRLGTNALSQALCLKLPDWRIHANRCVDQVLSKEK